MATESGSSQQWNALTVSKKSKLSKADITALFDAKYILSEQVVALLISVVNRNPKDQKMKDLLWTVQSARRDVHRAIEERIK